jgi:hypothetical protein
MEDDNGLVDLELVDFLVMDNENDVSTLRITFNLNGCCKRHKMRNQGYNIILETK